MPSQYVPDVVLLEILQDRYRQSMGEGPRQQGGGLRRQTGFSLERSAQRLVANPGQALQSTQFAVANDYALRSTGLDPDQAHRGAPLLRYGGRTFVNENRTAGGGFTGDLGSYGADLSNFIRGGEALMNRNTEAQSRGDISQQVANANIKAVSAEYGDITNVQGKKLLNQFNQLGSSQIDQLLQNTGLSADQLVSFQNTYRGGRSRLREITGAANMGEESQGERILRETIRQQQAISGTFSGAAGAAQEASALAAFQTSRQAQVAPTLLAGALDPNNLMQSDAVGWFNAGGQGQLQHSAETAQRAGVLSSLVAGNTGGPPVQQIARGQIRAGTSRGAPASTAQYDASNPLRYLENFAISNNFGGLGGGAFFGV